MELPSITIDNLTQGEVTYFKVEAINDDGTSDKSSALAVIPSQYKSGCNVFTKLISEHG